MTVIDHIFFYDSKCGFCEHSVILLNRWDSNEQLFFAPLEGKTADQLRANGIPLDTDLSQANFLDGGVVYRGADAFYRAAGYLRLPYALLKTFKLIPFGIDQVVYELVARKRKEISTRLAQACPLPPPDLARRMLQ